MSEFVAWWREPVGARGESRYWVFRAFASAFLVGIGLGGMFGLAPLSPVAPMGGLDPVVGFTLIAVGTAWQWWPRGNG